MSTPLWGAALSVRLTVGYAFVSLLSLAAMPVAAQWSVLTPADQVRLDALAREQARQDAQYHADMKASKAKLMRSTPLPASGNPLLGRWRVDGAGRSRGKGELGQLMDMLSNPGGAMCEALFGSGIVEFKPASWSLIDSAGDDSLGPMQYHGNNKLVWAVPEHKGFYFFGFEVQSPNRVSMIGAEDCLLVRVGAAAAGGQGGTADRAPAPSQPQRMASAPPAQAAAAPQSLRLSPQACQQTLLDKLGQVGANQVRALGDLRYRDAIEGKVPNTQNLRIDMRGSPCDDPRLNATLYDFDANGMLQAITFVWARPAGASPAPIFQERVRVLSLYHSGLPAPQAPGRLQADTSMGRLVLQDMPERSVLLEAYAARR